MHVGNELTMSKRNPKTSFWILYLAKWEINFCLISVNKTQAKRNLGCGVSSHLTAVSRSSRKARVRARGKNLEAELKQKP